MSIDVLSWDFVQWPAMIVTVAASWFVASSSEHRRRIGFWVFMLSNILWISWGLSSHAYALITLQLCLAVMNIRGARKNAAEDDAQADEAGNASSASAWKSSRKSPDLNPSSTRPAT